MLGSDCLCYRLCARSGKVSRVLVFSTDSEEGTPAWRRAEGKRAARANRLSLLTQPSVATDLASDTIDR